ncbi:MAG: hypothetical protein JWQ88_2990, partial [Rhodoferax sp.]|nr:hypothetical protein [Rhodoferax sp.]
MARWRLVRNCAMAPRTFFLHIGFATLILLLLSLAFSAIGAPLVTV